jgi:Flp pilus assembly protein TadG
MQTLKNTNSKMSRSILNLRRRSKDERGSSLVEMAVALPIFVVLLLGAAELAMIEYAGIEVSNAAMAGVQYGTQDPTAAGDTTGIGTAAQDDAPNIALSPTTVSQSCICSNGSASTCQPTDCSGSNIETFLTVQTTATYTPMIQLPGLPSSYTLHGQAIQQVLQ